jgi:rubrerythrin
MSIAFIKCLQCTFKYEETMNIKACPMCDHRNGQPLDPGLVEARREVAREKDVLDKALASSTASSTASSKTSFRSARLALFAENASDHGKMRDALTRETEAAKALDYARTKSADVLDEHKHAYDSDDYKDAIRQETELRKAYLHAKSDVDELVQKTAKTSDLECKHCTFINSKSFEKCEMCESPR